jgi:hypothetical protein
VLAALAVSLALAGIGDSGLLVAAPRLPDGRTLSVGTAAGASAGEGSGSLSAVWQVTPRLALTAGLSYLDATSSPFAGVRLALLDGLSLEARVKSEGFEPDGAEVEGAALFALSLGRLDLLASATAGHGESTWDVEGAGAVRAALGHVLDAGLEGRYRTTPDGSRHDLVAGPTLGVTLAGGAVRLQLLVGYGGNERSSGPAAFAGVSILR